MKDCNVGDLTKFNADSTTFLTADVPPSIATCGGHGISGYTDEADASKRKCKVLQDGKWTDGVLGDLKAKYGRSHGIPVTLPSVGTYILAGASRGAVTGGTSDFLPAGSREWQVGPPLPVRMYSGCAAAISDSSFLITDNQDVREFDAKLASSPTSSSGWQRADSWPQLLSPTQSMGCAVIGKLFVVAGGYNSGRVGKTEIIDIQTRNRRYGGDLKHARAYFRMVTVLDPEPRILAFGGGFGKTSRDEVEEFLEDTATWRVVGKMQDKRSRFGIVAVPRSLICPNK